MARLALWKDMAMPWRVCVCALVVGFAATAWCRSAETDDEGKNGSAFYLGGGALISDRPYIDTDWMICPVPLSAYEGDPLSLWDMAGGYPLPAGKGWSIGPVVQPRFQGYGEEDSSALWGMDDRNWSIDAGIGASWMTKIGRFGLSGVTDMLGRHKGQELEFSYTVLFKLGGLDFIPSAGMRWKSQDLVDYYYGVRPREAMAGRPAYEGENALDPFVRLTMRHKLTGRWSLLAFAQYEWLDDEIKSSPIVDADYDASFMVGMLYSW